MPQEPLELSMNDKLAIGDVLEPDKYELVLKALNGYEPMLSALKRIYLEQTTSNITLRVDIRKVIQQAEQSPF